MSREQVRTEYRVDSLGIIRSPGKFEGSLEFVPHFWSVVLEGGADETIEARNGAFEVVKLTDADRAEWPQLRDCTVLLMWESEQGFVHCATPSEYTLAGMRELCDESCTDEP